MHTTAYQRRGRLAAAISAGFIILSTGLLAYHRAAHSAPLAGTLNGKSVFPKDNPWNQSIADLPVDPQSDRIIARIGGGKPLHPDFGTVWNGAPSGIPYTVVSGTQARVPIKAEYADESDPGPFPIPSDAPIEGGPKSDGDRHVLVIDKDNWMLYEMWNAHPVDHGARWTCGSAAVFDLKSNSLRPAGWTSADAAGLPVFPGLVRYDETVEQKAITHALRFTVQHTRRAYVYPARHFASRSNDPDLPPMGVRLRLKSSFSIAGFSPNVQVILTALKKYGMILADNGSDWYLSGAPNPKWNDDELGSLRRVKGSDFEVVKMGALTSK